MNVKQMLRSRLFSGLMFFVSGSVMLVWFKDDGPIVTVFSSFLFFMSGFRLCDARNAWKLLSSDER